MLRRMPPHALLQPAGGFDGICGHSGIAEAQSVGCKRGHKRKGTVRICQLWKHALKALTYGCSSSPNIPTSSTQLQGEQGPPKEEEKGVEVAVEEEVEVDEESVAEAEAEAEGQVVKEEEEEEEMVEIVLEKEEEEEEEVEEVELELVKVVEIQVQAQEEVEGIPCLDGVTNALKPDGHGERGALAGCLPQRGSKWSSIRELEGLVRDLRSGNPCRQLKAAFTIYYTSLEDTMASNTLAVIGAMPPLVALLESTDSALKSMALKSLIGLSNKSAVTRTAMARAGAISKFARLAESSEPGIAEMVAFAFLNLSLVESHRHLISPSGYMAGLVQMLLRRKEPTTVVVAVVTRSLYNFSLVRENLFPIVEAGAIPPLLGLLLPSEPRLAETSLLILGNLLGTEKGRSALESTSPGFPECLVEVLGWGEQPTCQEQAIYLLMVMSHHGDARRKAIIREGALPVLLEMALLSTPLAQKRALRTLGYLRQEREKVSRCLSGPLSVGPTAEDGVDNGLVKRMVRMSLQRNMEKISKRANLPSMEVLSNAKLWHFTQSASSKSLRLDGYTKHSEEVNKNIGLLKGRERVEGEPVSI